MLPPVCLGRSVHHMLHSICMAYQYLVGTGCKMQYGHHTSICLLAHLGLLFLAWRTSSLALVVKSFHRNDCKGRVAMLW